MKHKHEVTTEKLWDDSWLAYDIDPNLVGSKTARGKSEDIAVSNWWALHGSLDEKHPRKNWKDYVAHEVVQGEP
jgi:hypothetical protein